MWEGDHVKKESSLASHKDSYKKPQPPDKKPTSLAAVLTYATILLAAVTLVSSPRGLPYLEAYFTDKITYGNDGSRMPAAHDRNPGLLWLAFNVHRFDDLTADPKVDFNENTLTVTIGLPEDGGFSADDVLANSIRFSYKDETIAIAPFDIETTGHELKMHFAWQEIEGFLAPADHNPTLDIAGKGLGGGNSGLGEKFTFTGHGTIPDLQKEFFRQVKRSYFIKGDDRITIPHGAEEAEVYVYEFFLDGQGLPADDVNWFIKPEPAGVTFQDGELLITAGAQPGSILLTAQLKENRYYIREMNIELIKPAEEKAVSNGGTIPPPKNTGDSDPAEVNQDKLDETGTVRSEDTGQDREKGKPEDTDTGQDDGENDPADTAPVNKSPAPDPENKDSKAGETGQGNGDTSKGSNENPPEKGAQGEADNPAEEGNTSTGGPFGSDTVATDLANTSAAAGN
jgi:hypothetical protein